ncbi:MAG: hypothetical protein JSS28_12970 [Proteobacteria bacterium]|nr:hypothetical protein [Pseudomonadota bacterium]
MKISMLCLAASASAFALGTRAATACSVSPPAHANARQLATLAKVPKARAEHVALKAVTNAGRKTIQSAELEAEGGCLIWSFDIGLAGSAVTHEVAVDAGDAAVLSVKTESPAQEADEARADAKDHGRH